MFAGRYFAKTYFAGRYWTPAGGIFVQLGGFGQVIGFGLPTITGGGGGAPLLVEIPSLGTLVAYALPNVTGGLARVERLFVRITSAMWRVAVRGIWRE